MQSCSNCESEYDSVRHIPRILVSCGHTYCQICISLLIQDEVEAQQMQQQQAAASSVRGSTSNNRGGTLGRKTTTVGSRKESTLPMTTPSPIVFECFECGIPCQVDPKMGVNALPKNMVLIPATSSSQVQLQMMHNNSSSEAGLADNISTTGATKPTQGRLPMSKHTIMTASIENVRISQGQGVAHASTHSQEDQSSLMNVDGDELSQSMSKGEDGQSCKLHPTKKIEAFCEKDYKLLCIDCILSDRHKNHEIVSIAKASEKHCTFLRSQQETSTNVGQKLISSKNEISRHLQLMKQQAEQNRRELSILYNAIRDMLIQREQALKTYISEVYQREETQCDSKIAQIEQALGSIDSFDDSLAAALEDSDIDLLRRYSERKLLVNTFNADQQIKELQQLNVAQFGLSNGPPATGKGSTSTKKNAAADLHQNDDQPPFQTLQEIKKDSEQLQVSKIINPNYKGQLNNCSAILPWTRQVLDDVVGKAGATNSLYQQHTAASQLKVNKRADGTNNNTKGGLEKANSIEEYVAPLTSTRPLNQYRRTTGVAASSTGLSAQQHQSNASPKPGENKRRQTNNQLHSSQSNNNAGGGISIYGQQNTQQHQSSAKAESKQSTRQSYQIGSSRTHSYNLTNSNLHQQHSSHLAAKEHQSVQHSGGATAKESATTSQINLFNQQSHQHAATTGKQLSQVTSKRVTAATTRQSQYAAGGGKNSGQTNTNVGKATIATQRVSLQEDTSLDLKQLSNSNIAGASTSHHHLTQTNSDKQLGLKLQKQTSLNNGGKNQQQRQHRVANEKQISDDLLNVQKQVNQVMSNLETFESKKRQLSAKKDSNRAGKMMFQQQQRASPQQTLAGSGQMIYGKQGSNNGITTMEYKAKLEHGTSQRPLTNQLHKRNSSSVQNDSLNNSQQNLARRMTSPPGKQQLLASQQPRQPAADNVIGNISLEQTASLDDYQKGADENDTEDLPILHIRLDQKQNSTNNYNSNQSSTNAGVMLERKLSNPNNRINQLSNHNESSGEEAYGGMVVDSGGVLQAHNDQPIPPSNQLEPQSEPKKQMNGDLSGSMGQHRIKSPIVRINLNSNNNSDVDLEEEDNPVGGKQLGDQNFSARQHPIGGADETGEEHIANMPDINNDSMVGDLNQLINDLNNGHQNPTTNQISARQRRQQQISATAAGAKSNSSATVKDKKNMRDNIAANDSSFKQAKAMYFDPASPQADNQQQAKTVEYVAATEGEYMAQASALAVSRKQPGAISGLSDKSDSSRKKSQSKLKYIEQSAKASQIQQNIVSHQQQQQALNQRRDRSRGDRSQPPRGGAVKVVPDLKLENVAQGASSSNEQLNFDLLISDRSSSGQLQHQQDPMVPTHEANKLPIPNNESAAIGGYQSIQAAQKGGHQEVPLSLDQFNFMLSAGNSAAGNQILSASSSAYSMNANSTSQASIDPFKALCQIRDEYIFVFSGFNERKLTHCEVFDAQRGIWKEIAHIQNPRTKFAAVPISKTRILIFGGKQADGQRTADIEEYNLKNNSFKTLPFKMPKARSGFAACIKREEARIYFCGGNSGSGSNGSVLRKFDCLDLKKGKWTRLGDMLMKRDELSVAFGPDGNIYAIGGFGGGLINSAANNNAQEQHQQTIMPEGAASSIATTNTTAADLDQPAQQQSSSDQFCQCLKEAERYNFATQQWDLLPPMKEARRALAAVVLPDGIYAIGGYDGRQYLATVEKFDLNRQEWVYVKSMNTARCTLSAVASSDCQYIYVLGGYNGKALNLVERYSVMNNTWELMPPMNVKRFMHQSVTLLRCEI